MLRSSATASAAPGLIRSAIAATPAACVSSANQTTVLACAANRSACRSSDRDAVLLQQLPVACEVRTFACAALYPAAGKVFETADGYGPSFQPGCQGFGQRVLRARFQCEEQRFQPFRAPGPYQVGHDRPAFGQRSGFVQYHRVDFFCCFEALRILNQNTLLRSFPDSHHDGRRGGQSQRTRACDDQYGHEGQQTVRKPAAAAEYDAHFFDAATIASPSKEDQLHMDAASHAALADALCAQVHAILG